MNTLDRVKAIIGDQTGLPAVQIGEEQPLGKGEFDHDTHKWSGLDLDSLDRIDLAMRLEEHFSIEIPDDDVDLPELGTAQGIADYLDKRLAEPVIKEGITGPEAAARAAMVHGIGATLTSVDEAGEISTESVNILSGYAARFSEANTPAETVPDYGAMSLDPLFDAVGMFEAIGADGQKWTEAFMQIACMATPLGKALRGFPHDDRAELYEIMASWFVNAIEAGRSAGQQSGELAGLGLIEPDPSAPDIAWESRNHPDRHVDYDGDLDAMGRWPGDEGYTEPFRNPRAIEGQRFRKRPVEIDAVRFLHVDDQDVPHFNVVTPPDWLLNALAGPAGHPGSAWTAWAHPSDPAATVLAIGTLEGNHIANPCDWIVRGVAGEIYPCKPAIFAATYDPVSPPCETAEAAE